ncbi:MAG: PorT family protein [Dysgonamonadaceae bacterium]|jgi:hypothetical protein|nr:PorT family protein [Dysgonamonadaceae bacterium]
MTENNKIKKNKFDEAVKKKLADYALPVDNRSWDEIETRLKAKRQTRWISISGIAVAASIAIIWLIIPINKQIINHDITEAEQQQLPRDEEGIAENVLEGKSNLVSHPPVRRIKPVFDRQEANDETTAGAYLPGYHVADQVEAPPPEEAPAVKEEIQAPVSFPKRMEEDVFTASLARNKKRVKSIGLQVGSGNYLAMNNRPVSVQSLRSDRDKLFSYTEGNVPYKKFDKVTHFLPLSFGLNFRKEINRYFSIESGIVYTYLYSKFKDNLLKQDAKQELHYLGIPLNGVVSVYGNKHSRWNIYASAGGMVEKGLFSSFVENHIEIPGVESHTNASDRIDGFQWSVHATVGVDYKIIKSYSFYIEPNVNYYFNNNQPVSARTEHPLVFGINAGFRYTW